MGRYKLNHRKFIEKDKLDESYRCFFMATYKRNKHRGTAIDTYRAYQWSI